MYSSIFFSYSGGGTFWKLRVTIYFVNSLCYTSKMVNNFILWAHIDLGDGAGNVVQKPCLNSVWLACLPGAQDGEVTAFLLYIYNPRSCRFMVILNKLMSGIHLFILISSLTRSQSKFLFHVILEISLDNKKYKKLEFWNEILDFSSLTSRAK